MIADVPLFSLTRVLRQIWWMLLASLMSMAQGYAQSQNLSATDPRAAIDQVRQFIERGALDQASVEREFGLAFSNLDAIYNTKDFGERTLPNDPRTQVASSAVPPFITRCANSNPASLADRSSYLATITDNRAGESVPLISFQLLVEGAGISSMQLLEDVFGNEKKWVRVDRSTQVYGVAYYYIGNETAFRVSASGNYCIGLIVSSSPAILEAYNRSIRGQK